MSEPKKTEDLRQDPDVSLFMSEWSGRMRAASRKGHGA